MLYTQLYLPLWTKKDRSTVQQILKKHEVNLPTRAQDTDYIFRQVVDDIVEAIQSKRRIIILVGDAGSGKRSAIVEACAQLNIVFHKKLVDPTTVDPLQFSACEQDQSCVINNLLFTTLADPQDADKYVQEIKMRLLPLKNVVTFLPLSLGNYKDIVLKHLLDLLRLEGTHYFITVLYN